MDAKRILSGRRATTPCGGMRLPLADVLDLQRMTAVLETLAGIGFETPPDICDLGCGAGWATSILGHFGWTTGVDLSDAMLAAQRWAVGAGRAGERRLRAMYGLHLVAHAQKRIGDRFATQRAYVSAATDKSRTEPPLLRTYGK